MTTTSHTPVRTKPFPGLPARFDGREKELLEEALKRNDLLYLQKDGMVERMLKRACQEFGSRFAVATSSGTASLHVAVGAAGVQAGAEVITSPITDMGTLIAILYQNAIPVFADVDPYTFNLTAASIEAAITKHTQAVIVVHLAGSPADMDAIMAVCRKRGVKVIEDCAQSFGCRYKGRHVGAFGDVGCFSFNNYKHLSCGDGGIAIMNDEELYYRAHNFADKYYDRHKRGTRLTHLGANYRMSELQGAVALAQFDRMGSIVETRHRLGDRLSAGIRGLRGVHPHGVLDQGWCSYWFYMFRVDEAKLGMTRQAFAERVNAEGIPMGTGYLPQPIYREPVFANKAFFDGGVWPAEVVSGRAYDYNKVSCPVAEQVLATSLRLSVHEGMCDADIDDCIAAIRKVCGG